MSFSCLNWTFSSHASKNKQMILPILIASNVDGVNVRGVVVWDKVVAHGIIEVVVPVRARVLNWSLVVTVTYAEMNNM